MRLHLAHVGKSSMEARLISDRQRWNDYVAMSPSCTITQSYEWGELGSSTGAQALRVRNLRWDTLLTRRPEYSCTGYLGHPFGKSRSYLAAD